MSTYFHLSYTVNVENKRFNDQAASLRSGIEQAFKDDSKNFSDIVKSDEVDTNITGTFSPSGSNSDERKKNAKKLIKSVFSGLMDELEIPSSAITVSCVVTAGTIDNSFEFTI
ncbi:hypothetical protein [Providencia sp. PROV156]|uniref:hypothetical protein n=1 Tax=Providencia sp. PROV156 TaxID=2949866 RepID=UPI0023498A60|nr:hypothetical protein [Providencia sp. PROV156]